MQALNAKCREKQSQHLVIQDIHSAAMMTLCGNSTVTKSCLIRSCPHCSTAVLDQHYKALVDGHGDSPVIYKMWDYKTYTSQKSGKVSRILTLMIKTTTIKELVSAFVTEAGTLGPHLVRAKWQQDQFAAARCTMPPRSAIMVMDFSENYCCSLQDEVQSYHWNQAQCTLHPMVAYVNSTDEVSDATHIESFVAISDDLNHDGAAVAHFVSLVERELQNRHSVKNLMQFTDCCAVQYRSKTNFADISFAKVATQRHYFEACHGKSPADGLGAVVKSAATRAVTHRKAVIVNAKDLYEFCQGNLAVVGDGIFPSKMKAAENSRRSFFYIEPDDIDHLNHHPNLKVPSGIMKVHCVAARAKYHVRTRLLSCFCRHCYLQEGTSCTNERLVGSWQDVHLTSVIDQTASPVHSDNSSSVHAVDPSEHDCEEIQHDQDFQENAYHAVYYTDPMAFYVGRIQHECTCSSIDGTHLTMMFLQRNYTNNTFDWPKTRNRKPECVPKQCIFTGPVQLEGAGPFVVKDMDTIILEKFAARKKTY